MKNENLGNFSPNFILPEKKYNYFYEITFDDVEIHNFYCSPEPYFANLLGHSATQKKQ